MADIEVIDGLSAHHHATRRIAQEPLWRRPSNWEGTCMMQGELATVLPDKHVPEQPVAAALLCLGETLDLHFSGEELALE
jgi:hypothetical protein